MGDFADDAAAGAAGFPDDSDGEWGDDYHGALGFSSPRRLEATAYKTKCRDCHRTIVNTPVNGSWVQKNVNGQLHVCMQNRKSPDPVSIMQERRTFEKEYLVSIGSGRWAVFVRNRKVQRALAKYLSMENPMIGQTYIMNPDGISCDWPREERQEEIPF
jgi:hypothetical protein